MGDCMSRFSKGFSLSALALMVVAGSYSIADAAGRFDPARPIFGAEAMRGAVKRSTREVISYDTKFAPGTIVVDTVERKLYHVMPDGKAVSYGVGVGRPGFEWSGTHHVTRKEEWPGWTPPPAMRKRQPYLPAFMPGGPQNPLGARALYLGSSIYRIHGTNEAQTIGQAVSSGCIRMMNDDVIELYENVDLGAKVVVLR